MAQRHKNKYTWRLAVEQHKHHLATHVCHAHTSDLVVQTYIIAMAKRGFKLLALALPILVGRSFIAPVGIPRVTQVNWHKRPSRTTRWASFEAEKLAQYLEPFATVIGTSLEEVAQGVRDASKNRHSISKQKSLVDIDDAQAHGERLAKIWVPKLLQFGDHWGNSRMVVPVTELLFKSLKCIATHTFGGS